jgi:2-oxoglutarate dehydrogenase E1 component
LRRQLSWPFRKPLIVMSPKSMLRHPLCVSPMEDFTNNKFQEVIGDKYAKPDKVKKILMCSGKFYWELFNEQQEKKREDIAIIRLEQLHPFPTEQVEAALSQYKNAKLFWVQEEPENMGSWGYLLRSFRNRPYEIISRRSSASPATGYAKKHAEEQANIIKRAFEL